MEGFDNRMSTIEHKSGAAGPAARHTAQHNGVAVNPKSNAVVNRARSWVGRHFQPGRKEMCANFVRHVFSEAGIPLAEARKPSDAGLLPQGAALGPGYANSLAGGEIGEKVAPGAHQPGDIVMFMNTYGNYKEGVITHVGIITAKDEFVHRPTMSAPVSRNSLSWGRIAEIRRPKSMAAAKAAGQSAKVFVHDGKACAIRAGHAVSHLNVRIEYSNRLRVIVDGREVQPSSMEVQIFY
jgi:probable lipoprotein NlpC